jgi:hypothetical protein
MGAVPKFSVPVEHLLHVMDHVLVPLFGLPDGPVVR